MRVLYIDTSDCLLAMWAQYPDDNTQAVSAGIMSWSSRHQVENLARVIERSGQLLRERLGADPGPGDKLRADLILVSRGPSSYTGLRVGLATAQVLGAVWNAPVVGIGELEFLASAHFYCRGRGGRLLVVNDAKRGEVFYQAFEARRDSSSTGRFDFLALTQPRVSKPAEITFDHGSGVISTDFDAVIGSADVLYPQDLARFGPIEPLCSRLITDSLRNRLLSGEELEISSEVATMIVRSAATPGIARLGFNINALSAELVRETRRLEKPTFDLVGLSPTPQYLRRPDVSVPRLKSTLR